MAMTLSGSNGITFNDASTQSTGKQACKAWAKFNGSAATIQGSYNVSSITRVSAGRYAVNFTTAMPNANYAVTGIGSHVVGVVALFATIKEGSRATTGYQIDYFDVGSNFGETTDANTAVFGS